MEFLETTRQWLGQPFLVWWITGSLLFIGLAGTVLPVIPGHFLIVLAAGLHWWLLGVDSGLEWWALVILGFCWGLAVYLEFLSGAVGAKVFGGSRWGGAGAVIGGIVGLFFMPFGLVLGPLIGAFTGEYFFAKKEVGAATKSGVGSVIGTMTGIVCKVILALLMVGYFLADVFWIG